MTVNLLRPTLCSRSGIPHSSENEVHTTTPHHSTYEPHKHNTQKNSDKTVPTVSRQLYQLQKEVYIVRRLAKPIFCAKVSPLCWRAAGGERWAWRVQFQETSLSVWLWMTQVSLLCKQCIEFITSLSKIFEIFRKTTKKDEMKRVGEEKGCQLGPVRKEAEREGRSLRKTRRGLLCLSRRPLYPPPLTPALSGELPAGRESVLWADCEN